MTIPDEVGEKCPLQGSTGRNVSDFFGLEKNFGLERDFLKKHKIGIVNVSNIPLQTIKQNENDVRNISKELNDLRDCDETNNFLLHFFCEKMKKYVNVKKFIVCGNFANVYFDKYLECDKQEKTKKKVKNKQIEVLSVPHPSYRHWQFIDKHKANLERLKTIFSKFQEK